VRLLVSKNNNTRAQLAPLVAGFAIMLLLLLAVTAVGIHHVRSHSKQLTAIVLERNQKAELASVMHGLHRERFQELILASYMTDPFERDEAMSRYASLAQEFIKARETFLALPMDAEELRLWEDVRREVREVEGVSETLFALLHEGRMADAQMLLKSRIAQHQLRISQDWLELVALQHRYNRLAMEEEIVMERRTERVSLTLSGLAILVGLLVAGFVVRAMDRLRNALVEEKERAQVTLESIGDAVIRIDANEQVTYLNPVAESLLGVTASEVEDMSTTRLLRLVSREDRQDLTHVLLEDVRRGNPAMLPLNALLLSRQDMEYEVEGRLSPIHAADGQTKGGVLVLRDVTEARQMQRRLIWQADHDDLTGLLNRRAFEDVLARILHSKRVADHPFSLLFMDLDRFKLVNDIGGHAAGDELLRQLSRLIHMRIRESDTLARLGGDEFAAVLPACPPEVAERIAGQIRDSVAAHHLVWEHQAHRVGISIGLVHVPPDWATLDDCLAAADKCCYQAKALGRNQVAVYTEEGDKCILLGPG
jgi:diguanylate cyclase (GGDEF)-like protein/PAS domain S-box-containing protein